MRLHPSLSFPIEILLWLQPESLHRHLTCILKDCQTLKMVILLGSAKSILDVYVKCKYLVLDFNRCIAIKYQRDNAMVSNLDYY